MPWYVLYTKPRNEKKTATLLERRNISVYCPVQQVLKQWSDRMKMVDEPVFRSYIFIHLQNYKLECPQVLETQGSVRFLWWQGKPAVVKDDEIEQIRKFLHTYSNAVACMDEAPAPGKMVRVLSGPLSHQSGSLIRVSGRKAFLKLTSLGIELVAEVSLSNLTAIE